MVTTALVAGCAPGANPVQAAGHASAAPVPAKAFDPTDRRQYRYLYAVYCDGRVDRLDLKNQTKTGSFQLSDRSGKPLAVAARDAGTSFADSCQVRPAVTGDMQDQATGLVNLVAGDGTDAAADGRKPYRLLTFSLPGWTLLGTRDLGRFENGPPRIQRAADGSLIAAQVPGSDLRALLARQARSYAGGEALADLRAEETSAGRVLLTYRLPGTSGTGFALSDGERARTVALQDLPGQNLASGWRLAPGGRFVLLTMKKPVPAERGLQQWVATGEMRLYDDEGRRLATLNDARVAGPSMVLMPKEDIDRDTPRTAGHWLNIALTPDGLAVFSDPLGNYRFVELGHVFGIDPVAGLDTDDYDSPLPGLVYAAQ
jgi:hypothetical protein